MSHFIFTVLIFFSISSLAQVGLNIEETRSATKSLLNLYDSKCDESVVAAVSEEMKTKLDLSKYAQTAYANHGCVQGKETDQPKSCLAFLDEKMGKPLRLSLKKYGCQPLAQHWMSRLALQSCIISRETEQQKADNKLGGYKEIMDRGYCTYKAKNCRDSSVKNLDDYQYNCAIVPLENTDGQFTCLDSTQFASCSVSPVKGKKFAPVVKPGGLLFSRESEVDTGTK